MLVGFAFSIYLSVSHHTCKPVYEWPIEWSISYILLLYHDPVANTIVPALSKSKLYFYILFTLELLRELSFHRGLCWLVLRRCHKLFWLFTVCIYICIHCFFPINFLWVFLASLLHSWFVLTIKSSINCVQSSICSELVGNSSGYWLGYRLSLFSICYVMSFPILNCGLMYRNHGHFNFIHLFIWLSQENKSGLSTSSRTGKVSSYLLQSL